MSKIKREKYLLAALKSCAYSGVGQITQISTFKNILHKRPSSGYVLLR